MCFHTTGFDHIVQDSMKLFQSQRTLKITLLFWSAAIIQPHTCMRLSTLSWRAVGGLYLGRMERTKTPSTNSWEATRTWKRCPQFFTQASRTCVTVMQLQYTVQRKCTHHSSCCIKIKLFLHSLNINTWFSHFAFTLKPSPVSHQPVRSRVTLAFKWHSHDYSQLEPTWSLWSSCFQRFSSL